MVADARSASSGTRTVPRRGVRAVKTYQEPEEDDKNLESEEDEEDWEKPKKKRRLKAVALVSSKRAQPDVSIGFSSSFMVLQETGVKGEEGTPAPASRSRWKWPFQAATSLFRTFPVDVVISVTNVMEDFMKPTYNFQNPLFLPCFETVTLDPDQLFKLSAVGLEAALRLHDALIRIDTRDATTFSLLSDSPDYKELLRTMVFSSGVSDDGAEVPDHPAVVECLRTYLEDLQDPLSFLSAVPREALQEEVARPRMSFVLLPHIVSFDMITAVIEHDPTQIILFLNLPSVWAAIRSIPIDSKHDVDLLKMKRVFKELIESVPAGGGIRPLARETVKELWGSIWTMSVAQQSDTWRILVRFHRMLTNPMLF